MAHFPPEMIFEALRYTLCLAHTHTHTHTLTLTLTLTNSNSMVVSLLHESVCSYDNYTKCCYLLP